MRTNIAHNLRTRIDLGLKLILKLRCQCTVSRVLKSCLPDAKPKEVSHSHEDDIDACLLIVIHLHVNRLLQKQRGDNKALSATTS